MKSPSLPREDESIDCYQEKWLEKFEHAEGTDLLLLEEEKRAFEALATLAEDGTTPRSELRYLDIGTCTGRYLAWALDRGIRAVHGLDRSHHAVAFSRRKLGARAHIVQADILIDGEMSSLSNMDLVSIMFGTFNHFSPTQQHVVLRSVRSCLRDGGSLVVSSWQPGKCNFSIYDSSEQALLASRGLSLDELRARANECGLDVVDWAYTSSTLVARIQRTSTNRAPHAVSAKVRIASPS